jgi:sugar phosphate permease
LETRDLETRDVNPSDFVNGWPPFNESHCKSIIGAVDYSWLFSYAFFLVASGLIADRVNLRYFLTVGMIGSGIFVGLLGVGYFGNVHQLAYFIIIQIVVGIFESTGWPGVVAVMGNWFGKQNRGLVLGIWNSHTSIGNILGTVVPSIWARRGEPWGWSFIVPGIVMIVMGLVIFMFLVIDPADVGLPPPKHHLTPDSDTSSNGKHQSNKNYRDNGHESEAESIEMDNIENNTSDQELLDQDHQDKQNLIENTESEDNTNNEKPKAKAISLIGALRVPGVIEYSLALFFAKLVAYTFLFWLPYYVAFHPINGEYVGEQSADLLATLYDMGGIIGGISTGGLSDIINARAISCVIMMYFAIPTLLMYRFFGSTSIGTAVVLILLCGLFINGPYALITTAVSNDLV